MGEAAKHVLSACFKLWNLEEVSHEMLVFLHPRVSSRVSGFPVASPCLWGKLQNLSFSKVSKQDVMSFCVAGVALCDIPTCLLTCRKCQNWRKSRTKCSTLYTLHSTLYTLHSTLHTWHFTLQTLHFILLTPHFTLHTPHFTLYTPHFTLHTPHFSLYTPHCTLYTFHSTLHTLHSTFQTPQFTL